MKALSQSAFFLYSCEENVKRVTSTYRAVPIEKAFTL